MVRRYLYLPRCLLAACPIRDCFCINKDMKKRSSQRIAFSKAARLGFYCLLGVVALTIVMRALIPNPVEWRIGKQIVVGTNGVCIRYMSPMGELDSLAWDDLCGFPRWSTAAGQTTVDVPLPIIFLLIGTTVLMYTFLRGRN